MRLASLAVLTALVATSALATAAPRAKVASRKPKVTAKAPAMEEARPPSLNAPEQRVHQALGLPKPRVEQHPNAVVLSRQGFISLYDPDKKVPLLVSSAWSPNAKRSDARRDEDSLVPASIAQASASDYTSSSYVRGPLAPGASLIATVPQARHSHLGPWSQFEEFYQRQAVETGKVAYVQTGSIFEGEPRSIGSGVAVPSHMFAIAVLADERADLKAVRPDEIGASVKVFAVIIPNSDSEVKPDDSWTQYLVPVSRIAQRTRHPGFLAGLSDDARKVAWNYKVPTRAVGLDWIVDGVVIRTALSKQDTRRAASGRVE